LQLHPSWRPARGYTRVGQDKNKKLKTEKQKTKKGWILGGKSGRLGIQYHEGEGAMKGSEDQDIVARTIQESILVKQGVLQTMVPEILQAAEYMVASLRAGGKLILFGNGGSAGDAQHIAAELVGRFERERRALPAIALTTNSSTLTAIANDYDYSKVFSRQVEAWAHPGDVVIGISTSGNSPNVLEGIAAAKSKRAKTIGLTGEKGGRLASQADLCLKVPSSNTARIQESHILIGHLLCLLIEKNVT
jgi:D-sedoheptulose 7-phosphate isomerase